MGEVYASVTSWASAIRWTGENANDVALFLSENATIRSYKVMGDMIAVNGEYVICKGQWIVAGDGIMLMNDETFKKSYVGAM